MLMDSSLSLILIRESLNTRYHRSSGFSAPLKISWQVRTSLNPLTSLTNAPWRSGHSLQHLNLIPGLSSGSSMEFLQMWSNVPEASRLEFGLYGPREALSTDLEPEVLNLDSVQVLSRGMVVSYFTLKT